MARGWQNCKGSQDKADTDWEGRFVGVSDRQMLREGTLDSLLDGMDHNQILEGHIALPLNSPPCSKCVPEA